MRTLVDIIIPIAARVVRRKDLTTGALRRAPGSLIGRLQWSLPACEQVWIFGSSWEIADFGAPDGVYNACIEYCEYNAKGERHGYHFRRQCATPIDRIGTQTFWSAHWRDGVITRYHDVFGTVIYRGGRVLLNISRFGYDSREPDDYAHSYTGPGYPYSTYRYRDGELCCIERRTFHEHNNKTTLKYKVSQYWRNNIPVGTEWYQSVPELPSLRDVTVAPHCFVMRNLVANYIPSIEGFATDASKFADYDPHNWPSSYVVTNLRPQTLVDIVLPTVGRMLTRDMLARIPKELHWRLQCATPPVRQPEIFGSATWIVVETYGLHMFRKWQQHNPITGAQDGVAGLWLVGRYWNPMMGAYHYPRVAKKFKYDICHLEQICATSGTGDIPERCAVTIIELPHIEYHYAGGAKLGTGSYASVYEHGQCVVKINRSCAPFVRELRCYAILNHKNIAIVAGSVGALIVYIFTGLHYFRRFADESDSLRDYFTNLTDTESYFKGLQMLLPRDVYAVVHSLLQFDPDRRCWPTKEKLASMRRTV